MFHTSLLDRGNGTIPVDGLFHQTPRTIIIGDFSNTNEQRDIDCCLLSALLIKKDFDVTTVSLNPLANAQLKLSFHTPLKAQRSAQRLLTKKTKNDVQYIVFVDHFLHANLISLTHWRRLKEKRRRFGFLSKLLNSNANVTLIWDTRESKTWAKLLVEFSGNLRCVLKNTQEQIEIGKTTLQLPAKPSPNQLDEAQRILVHHADFENLNERLSIMRVKTVLTEEPDRHISRICQIAEASLLHRSDFVRRLRKGERALEAIQFSAPPYPTLEKSIAESTGQLTAYMLHLHKIFNLADRFPLSDSNSVAQFVHWYKSNAHAMVPSGWVPQKVAQPNLPDIAPIKDETIALAGFLNQQITFLELPHSLRTLLKHRKYPKGPNGLALLMAILVGKNAKTVSPKSLWKDRSIEDWFQANLAASLPTEISVQHHCLRPRPMDHATIVGWADHQTGLAENCMMSLSAFQTLNLPTKLRDATNFQLTQPILQPNATPIKRPFVLHHVNADRVPLNIVSPNYVRRNDVAHIGYCLWETTRVPNEHLLGMKMLDRIWAPSNFVADVYRNAGAKNVRVVGKGIKNLERLANLGQSVKRHSSQFTAFMAYNFHSSVERKNPLVAVNAFSSAFPKRQFPNCRLIIKSTPSQTDHWGDPNNQTSAIRRLARKDRRITFIEKFVSTAEFHQMIAQSHVILSPHRGEGFGYLPALALAMGRPVICSDFGGTQDFCTPETAKCVPAELVTVPKGHAIFDADGAQWADVRPSAFTDALLAVYTDYKAACQKAEAGQKLIQTTYSIPALAKRYKTELTEMGLIHA